MKVRTVAASGLVAALCLLMLVAVHSGIRHRYGLNDLVVLAALWLCFAAGVLVVRRIPVRVAGAMILTGGAAVQLMALTARPHTSDDIYRYIWDGRVQAAGIDPYAYVPAAPELVGQRDRFIWPPASRWCVPPGTPDPRRPGAALAPGCTLINRPTVQTVYPPAAEAYFVAVEETSPAGSGALPMQAAAATIAVAVTVLLMAGLRRPGGDPRMAAIWAWCPTIALEAGNGAHVDVVAVALAAGALLTLSRARSAGRSLLGGSLLGLAVATKVYPVLVAPAVARRRPVMAAAGAVAAIAAIYLPHLLAAGGQVLGYLPGYLQQEGYRTGSRFALLRLVLPEAWRGPAAAVILAAVAIGVLRFADPRRPWDGALVLTGAALILTSPAYPWYSELVVALVALAGRVEWLPLAVAGYLPLYGYEAGLSWADATLAGYGTACAVAIAAALARFGLGRRTAGTVSYGAHRLPGAGADSRLCYGAAGAPGPGGAGTLGHGGAPDGRSAGPVPRARPLPGGTATLSVDVVLPCLNEAAAIPYVLSRLPVGYRAIVVDNGSSDGSAEIASRLGAYVIHEPLRGFGAACQAGLRAASADVVCFCDCDGSLDLAELPLVADPVLDRTSDLVLGRRRPRSLRAWPLHARLANLLLARRIRGATGVTLRDLGPMRAARREPLLALGLRDRRFGYPLEMVLSAARAGWQITETDVRYEPRTGRSKVTGTVAGTLRAAHDMRQAWKAATR